MANPVKIVTIGGVKLDANFITAKKTLTENGITKFVITFKDGSTVKYPAQSAKNGSSIRLDDCRFGECVEDYQMSINRIWGLEYTGTKGVDHVTLNGCASCKIDVRDGNISYNGDYVEITNCKPANGKRFVSENNEIQMDQMDVLFDNGEWIKGAGVHHQGDNSEELK